VLQAAAGRALVTVSLCCSVFLFVTICCSVMQCDTVCCNSWLGTGNGRVVFQRGALHYVECGGLCGSMFSALQCVAARCSSLQRVQYVATWCSS